MINTAMQDVAKMMGDTPITNKDKKDCNSGNFSFFFPNSQGPKKPPCF
jgi:hypothetical protein